MTLEVTRGVMSRNGRCEDAALQELQEVWKRRACLNRVERDVKIRA